MDKKPLESETIAAIATAPGRGGIGIVRLSGVELTSFATQLCGKTPEARRASYADFRAADGSTIDRGLILYFPAPHSFTGEAVLELQAHGGPVVMQLLLERCLELGARLAQPGEFSQRAFLNNKIDLAQAEAIADLIEASTAQAARSAVRSLAGAFSQAIQTLQVQLTELRALTEATLDFPDEEIDFLQAADAQGRLDRLHTQLQDIFARARQGRLLQQGLHIVLAGLPNVGKSSLLNALAGEDLAIVTPIPGTTRDALRTQIQIEGIPLHIIDTAGLRSTKDEVEKIGIERSWREIEHADILILLTDTQQSPNPHEKTIRERLPSKLPCLTVINKIDLTGQEPSRYTDAHGTCITLSAKTGQGLPLLRQELLNMVGWQNSEEIFTARTRHLEALKTATHHLDSANSYLSSHQHLELFAEELRLAQQALSRITGEYTSDDLLGEIFSRFCIGK